MSKLMICNNAKTCASADECHEGTPHDEDPMCVSVCAGDLKSTCIPYREPPEFPYYVGWDGREHAEF